jgi:hypothetical protein
MVLPLFTRDASQTVTRRFRPAWHPEYPIEQTVRCRQEQTRAALLQEAWRRRSSADDSLYVADYDGLRILAPTEGALQHAVATLENTYGNALVVEPLSIRYIHGALVLEPWMAVLVNVPARYGFVVEHDFVRRRGQVRRFDQHGAAFVLEGEAPLADLLGYSDWLRVVTKDDPSVAMWLSRYLPIDSDGPKAA